VAATTLQPSTDAGPNDMVPHGGSGPHAQRVQDSNDATYLDTTVPDAWNYEHWNLANMPAGAWTIQSVVAFMRVFAPLAAAELSLELDLGGTRHTYLTLAPNDGAPTTYTAAAATDPLGAAWTSASLDAVTVWGGEFHALGDGPGRIYEAGLTVTYVAAPAGGPVSVRTTPKLVKHLMRTGG